MVSVMLWMRRLVVPIVAVGSALAISATALAAETIPSCTVSGNTVSCGVQAVQPSQVLSWLSIVVGIGCAAIGVLMAWKLGVIIYEIWGADSRTAPDTMHKLWRFGLGAVLFFGMGIFFGLLKGLAVMA